VQVGAFTTREQAEALRARLAGGGHDAYVAESEGPGGARYRVRVGAFATRDEARQAAERLAGERQLTTFVTTH
jgi:cell division protein FtsN